MCRGSVELLKESSTRQQIVCVCVNMILLCRSFFFKLFSIFPLTKIIHIVQHLKIHANCDFFLVLSFSEAGISLVLSWFFPFFSFLFILVSFISPINLFSVVRLLFCFIHSFDNASLQCGVGIRSPTHTHVACAHTLHSLLAPKQHTTFVRYTSTHTT